MSHHFFPVGMNGKAGIKVLHVVAGSLDGGAAKGALCLHAGLLKLNVDSKILNNRESDEANNIYKFVPGWISGVTFFLSRMIDFLVRKLGGVKRGMIFAPGFTGYDITQSQLYKEADIINLHWILGFCNFQTIRKIEKPVVWTLRDMWPFTGGCQYPIGCEKFEKGCQQCGMFNYLSGQKIPAYLARKKQEILAKSNIHYVGISKWISDAALHSLILKDVPGMTIHNNIDVNEFFPVAKQSAREAIGLDTDKKIVVFGAHSLDAEYKGGDLLLKALRRLSPDDYLVAVFGGNDQDILPEIQQESRSFGFIADPEKLRNLYSAGDVFVAPSKIEAFGKTIAEAMACKTPVVCFDAAGPGEIVDHKVNGFKAVPFEAGSLAEGIEWVVNSNNYGELCANARRNVEEKFSNTVIAKKYLELYTEILENSSGGRNS